MFFDSLVSSQNPSYCPCLCNTGSCMGCMGSQGILHRACPPREQKELCPTSLSLSTDSAAASQAMKIPLVSILQVKSMFRMLSRQGLSSNSRKQKLLHQRKKTLNSKSIKILSNIVAPLSNLWEGSCRG